MEYRTGKCSQCGAEYKVPASFAHNVARCKKCKGVVHLSAPPGAAPAAPAAGTPRPSPAPAAAQPAQPTPPAMPAKRVVPKPEAPRAPRPVTPAAKQPTPAPRPTAVPRPAAAAASSPAPAAKATAKPAAKPESRGASAASRRASGADDGDRGEKRGKRAPKAKKPPMAGILSGVALVLVAAGVFLFRGAIFGSEKSAEPEVAGTADSSAPPAATETGSTPTPVAPDETAREPVAEEKPAEAPAKPEPKAKAPKDPNSIDLAAIPDFQPTPDTSAEEWAQMNEWMQVWMDPDAGAAGNKAKISLTKNTRRAVPAILNYFKKQDFATKEGRSNGDQCQKALEQICNGTNYDWKYVDATHPYDDPGDVYFCKRVAELWCNSWKQVEQSIEAWIKIAKLEEKDPEEAARLREMFGGQSAPAEPGSNDDLEVD